MNKKINITIGFSLYNESKNILRLTEDLLQQKRLNFKLDKIVIISDGSTDNTVKIIEGMNNAKIKLISENVRAGKPTRINQIFSIAESEVVVILDGDIILSDLNVISKLVNPFLEDKRVMLSSGRAKPLKPRTFVSKIFYTGVQIWDGARKSVKENEMYYCEGQIRAFRKKLYQEIKFPATSSEDVYPYLYCKTHDYKFKSVPGAVVYYNLPKTVADYLKQFNRFWKSEKVQKINFGEKITNKYYSIKLSTKLFFAGKYFFKQPVFTLIYLGFLILPKLLFFLNPGEINSVWEIAQTTKSEKNKALFILNKVILFSILIN